MSKTNLADFLFIENLHFMYNKTTLLRDNNATGFKMEQILKQKYDIEKQKRDDKVDQVELDNKMYAAMILELGNLFSLFAGGGTSLEQLKNTIRERIKKIKHR